MKIVLEKKQNCTVFDIEGDIVMTTIGELEEEITAVQRQGEKHFVLDLLHVEVVDSRGAGLLSKLSLMYGKDIVFADIPFEVQGVLKRLMLFDKFITFRNAEEAVQHFENS